MLGQLTFDEENQLGNDERVFIIFFFLSCIRGSGGINDEMYLVFFFFFQK